MAEYVSGVNVLADAAAKAAEAAYLEMRRREPTASVPDIRGGIVDIVEAVASAYGSASGELAARTYDELAAEAGADVPEAYVLGLDEKALRAIEKAARYHVGLLAGDRGDI